MSDYEVQLPDRLSEREFREIAAEADTLLDVQREARLASAHKRNADGAGNRNVTREALEERGLLSELRGAENYCSPQDRLQELGLTTDPDDADAGGERA